MIGTHFNKDNSRLCFQLVAQLPISGELFFFVSIDITSNTQPVTSLGFVPLLLYFCPLKKK